MDNKIHQNEQEVETKMTSNHEHNFETENGLDFSTQRKPLTIYRKVAKSALMSWNGLSEAEAEAKVRTETFEQLENQVGASGTLNYAVEAIAKLLQLHQIEKEYFQKVVIDKENITMTQDQKICLARMKEHYSTLGEKNSCSDNILVLHILSQIHDGWVKDNGKKFNQENREAKRYQHLPLMLIGWKEAKADLLFLSPILEAITGEKIDETKLETAYKNHVPTYLAQKGIDSKSKLISKIMKGSNFYSPLTEQNTAQTKEIATAMADKVLEVNPQVNTVLKASTSQM